MTCRVVPTRVFEGLINDLIKKRKVLNKDFEDLKKLLTNHPDKGDVMSSTGGLRKIRLKSVSKGKSGGFRVCYYYDPLKLEVFLIWVFSKNEQENLTAEEKKDLKTLVEMIKRK